MDDATVDALTEDLTSDLARVYDLFVIGRSSAFTYKGKPIDIKHVGEELGVRYVVEGSVRKADGKLRVNVQLLATETGAQVWGDNFGIERDGISYSVDDIIRQISHILGDRVNESESTRSERERPTNPDVVDIVLRARALQAMPPNPQRQSEIVALYERALKIDPSSATAVAGLAESLMGSIYTYEDPTTPEKLRRAEELVLRAEQLRPYDMPVMFARLSRLMREYRCSDVIPAAHRMIAIYPNTTSSHMFLGICLMFDGRAADAIPEYEQTIRLDPRNAQIFIRYFLMGYALLFLDRYDEAVVWFQKSLAANPSDSPRQLGNMRAAIAAAQALAGRNKDARASATEAVRLWPPLTARSYYNYKITNPLNAAQVSRMRDGLRVAGIRDHADEDADTGVPADEVLHTNYEAPTPSSVPGARIIRTADLAALIEQRKPLVIDTNPWGGSIPDAVGLWGAGVGGDTSDEFQARLDRKTQQLTGGDRTAPVVAMGSNAERFQGRNLALRLVALGYTQVYWYRGGREAWEVAGLPETELVMQDW
jgi:TolB-like protein